MWAAMLEPAAWPPIRYHTYGTSSEEIAAEADAYMHLSELEYWQRFVSGLICEPVIEDRRPPKSFEQASPPARSFTAEFKKHVKRAERQKHREQRRQQPPPANNRKN